MITYIFIPRFTQWTGGPGSNYKLVAMSITWAQILFFKIGLGSLEKWLILELAEEKYKQSLEHIVMPKNMNALRINKSVSIGNEKQLEEAFTD